MMIPDEKRIMNSPAKPLKPIHVGDRVRSYDFPDLPGMKTTCYVEGVVEAIGHVPGVGGPDRYSIKISRRVWRNNEDTGWQNGKEFPTGYAYPPVNGIPTSLGSITRGVERMPDEPPPDAQPAWSHLKPGRKPLLAELERYLRDKGWPYVSVDDARKAIFGASEIKPFDFLVYSSTGPNLLVFLVTRKPTPAQVRQMQEWEKVFGKDFAAAFTFQVGGAWRTLSLQDLQAPDPLGHLRLLDNCISEPSTERNPQ